MPDNSLRTNCIKIEIDLDEWGMQQSVADRRADEDLVALLLQMAPAARLSINTIL